jgi:hypothetical protein
MIRAAKKSLRKVDRHHTDGRRSRERHSPYFRQLHKTHRWWRALQHGGTGGSVDIVLLVVVVFASFAGMSYFLERFIYKRAVDAQEVRAGWIYLLLVIAIAYALFDSLAGYLGRGLQ